MGWGRVCGLLVLSGMGWAASGVHAASKETTSDAVAARRGELHQLHGRLKKLHQDIAHTEETRASTRSRLKETETAMTETRRHLRELEGQRDAAESSLDKLHLQSQQLEKQISTQQAQLGQLLRRQYVHGDIDALRLLLSGQRADQVMRDLHYTSVLSRAKADLLGVLRQSLAEKQRLGVAVQTRQDELVVIEARQQQQHTLLLAQQQQRQQVLARLGDKLKVQRDEAEKLQRDEKRLGSLIDQLASQARLRARTEARRKAARSQMATPPPRTPAGGQRRQDGERTERTERIERNEQEPADLGPVSHFSTLKGRLRLPVRGDVLHRFGTPRMEGGGGWKGVFIRAIEGAEIKSIAPGRVVFADSLRGFGPLIIIDHGEGWLSVYGNNQSLLRRVDEIVKAGDAIAMAGHGGVNPETGLYFELRQQGRTIDPLGWVSIR